VAHSLSAKKRIRQTLKRRSRNRANKSAMKKQIKKFVTVAKTGTNAETVETEYRKTQKKIDQMVTKGILHKKTAARRKSKLARQGQAVKAKS